MQHLRPSRGKHRKRSGAVLVLVALLLVVMLGMMGLVIDGGLFMSAFRQTQNVADAAATAAAMDLLRGNSASTASSTGVTFVQQYNGLSKATTTINIPPSSGPHAGNGNYAEAIVSNPVNTWFIQVLGVNQNQSVTARAVAGYEAVTAGEGVIALNPGAIPGLSVTGGATLKVNGAVLVNSEGGGLDQNGQPMSNGGTGDAAKATNNSTVMATDIEVVGGVNSPSNFLNYDTNSTANPLHTGAALQPDPLANLPTPTTANGASATAYSAVSVNGNQKVTLSPGVYPSISITGGTVTFTPGIYVIASSATNALKITGGTVTANGVMFYNTGSDFNVSTGLPDANDGTSQPSGGSIGGGVTINASMTFTPYSNPGSPFDGMLFYQRRWNTNTVNIQGNSGSGDLSGTLYAKWATVSIAGQGTYDAQFISGAMAISGNGIVTVNYAGKKLGKGNQVFLVE